MTPTAFYDVAYECPLCGEEHRLEVFLPRSEPDLQGKPATDLPQTIMTLVKTALRCKSNGRPVLGKFCHLYYLTPAEPAPE